MSRRLGMNEMQVAQPEQIAAPSPRSRCRDPLQRWTLIILVLFVLVFGWTLITNRLTPYTSDASVRVVPALAPPRAMSRYLHTATCCGCSQRAGSGCRRAPDKTSC
jgi:hypothetical protein